MLPELTAATATAGWVATTGYAARLLRRLRTDPADRARQPRRPLPGGVVAPAVTGAVAWSGCC